MSPRTRGAGRRSPLLRTLLLTLRMGGIATLIYVPLFIGLSANPGNDHVITLLLAASALLPTFGASSFASIEKHTTKEYLLSALIALPAHAALTFALMAACSIVLSVENLAHVILLSVSWIPAIVSTTILSLKRSARTKRLAKRGLRMSFESISSIRARNASILGGILFAASLHICNGALLFVAQWDSGSVLAGLIFPFVWGLYAVHRPHPSHCKAYRLAAIITGAVLSVATYTFAVILYQGSLSSNASLFTLTFRAPLTSPAIPLALATLSLTTILPLRIKPTAEDTEVDTLA